MYCRSCGALIHDDSAGCGACGAPVQPLAQVGNFSGTSYLAASLAATAFCCLPAGVVGIVYAAQIEPKLRTGDVAGARLAAKQSRIWTLIACGGGLVILLGYGAMVATGAFFEIMKK